MASKGRKGERVPAAALPVARVCVDVSLPHLDRPFDYRVSTEQDADAVPGCRVRVRFAGKLTDGYLLERAETSEHPGRLSYLDRVVSAQPVLTPEIAGLARAVADRYAGTLSDVLRLAVPPRHARVEAEPAAEPPPVPGEPPLERWLRYPRGTVFLDAVRARKPARSVWQAVPGEDWPSRLAEAACVAAAQGRGAVLVLPDYRDVARVHEACLRLLDPAAVVALTADLGPAKRYRRWLAVLRGTTRVVVGTRAAMFAPVADPGLLVVWDDGDDLHAEQRAPYPHVREVLAKRAQLSGSALLVGGFARTAEAQLLLESGWAHEVSADRETVRAAAPRINALGESDFEQARDPAARAARLPTMALEAARGALRAGAPVLVQVPRRGYVPTLACGSCRARARCRHCAGPLGLPGGPGGAGPASCRWCGRAQANFRCPECGSPRLRAMVVGSRRTAEELGRALPEATVRLSGAGEVRATVESGPSLVVCTPGAEPVAEGGFGTALLLDGWALLGRADLRAAEEAVRRWMTAAALVRPARDGGRVVLLAEAGLRPVQAVVRWNPAWYAGIELAERRELGFPPVSRMAALDGEPAALSRVLDTAPLPEDIEVLGPVPLDNDAERALLRVPRTEGARLAALVRELVAARSARKDPDQLRVRLDPPTLV